MSRLRFFLILAVAGNLLAQEQVQSLRNSADKAAADWEALAKGLETKISTLLPCDPKSRAAVEEVSHASDARLAALSAYLKAEAVHAKADTEAAKKVLAVQASLSGGWNTERAEALQQQVAIEAQLANLKESMRKRGSLSAAEQVLNEIDGLVKQRAAKAEDQAGRGESIDGLLGDLVVAYQSRQTALENENEALAAEIAKWNAYYAARISRAITECTIINPGGAARKKHQ
jgi:hypothetical protein